MADRAAGAWSGAINTVLASKANSMAGQFFSRGSARLDPCGGEAYLREPPRGKNSNYSAETLRIGLVGLLRSRRSGRCRHMGGSGVLVHGGPFPDVLWPFGEGNCKARTKILAPRLEEG